jgi:hypothetical protein
VEEDELLDGLVLDELLLEELVELLDWLVELLLDELLLEDGATSVIVMVSVVASQPHSRV